MNEKIYRISFYSGDKPNWIAISNIDKETLDSFIDYLYSLERNINIFPYVSGGMTVVPHDEMDRTFLVKRIVGDIKKKIPKNEMLNRQFVHRWDDSNYPNPFNLFFKEDLYEFIERNTKLSIEDIRCIVDITPYSRRLENNHFDSAELYEEFNTWHAGIPGSIPWIGTSRWEFVYMFRNEFKKYMHDRGYKVVVDGGWVLNSKEREMRLGLIDENGELY